MNDKKYLELLETKEIYIEFTDLKTEIQDKIADFIHSNNLLVTDTFPITINYEGKIS